MAMEHDDVGDVRTSYDLIADKYVRHIYDELKDKSLDRELLDRFRQRFATWVSFATLAPARVTSLDICMSAE
jgi:hypothetical protein